MGRYLRSAHLWLLLLVFGIPSLWYREVVSAGLTNWTVLRLSSGDRGRAGEAVAEGFEAARRVCPEASMPWLEEGRWRLAAGDVLPAIAALRAAVERDPHSRRARFFLGLSLLESGQVEAAAGQFRRSGLTARQRGEFDLLTDLGWRRVLAARTSENSADWQRAEYCYRTARALFSDEPEYWRSLAVFYLDLKPDADAAGIEELERAKAAFPSDSWPYLETAIYHQRWGRQELALAEVREALVRGFQDDALFDLAVKTLRDSSRPVASEWLAATIGLVPEQAEVRARLSRLAVDFGPAPTQSHVQAP